jgi:hypothetical protein
MPFVKTDSVYIFSKHQISPYSNLYRTRAATLHYERDGAKPLLSPRGRVGTACRRFTMTKDEHGTNNTAAESGM